MAVDLAELIHRAKQNGYGYSFELSPRALHCSSLDREFHLDHLTVDKVQYAFTGSDAGDEATLYWLSAADGTKGYFIIPHPAGLSADERTILDLMSEKSKTAG